MSETNVGNGSNKFWDEYSSREDLTLNSLMNLEVDPDKSVDKFTFEKARLEGLIEYNPSWKIVDLGGGVGLWAEYFSEHMNQVTLVERAQKFIEIARERITKENISIVHSDVTDFDADENLYDVVFISGVTIYLSDERLDEMMKKIKSYLKSDGLFIHRDAYGIEQRFVLDKIKSESLQLDYSAVYRSREEYDQIFVKNNMFSKLFDEDMYPTESDHNKRRETKLRLAIYKNTK